MNKNKYIFLVTILTASIFLMSSCSAAPASTTVTSQSAQTSTTAQSSTSATTSAGAQSSTAASAQGNTVSISSFKFIPETLTIKAGTTVVWTNNNSAPHDIKFASFTSPSMNKGQTFEFKFDTKGTFDYICGIHPTMTGKIIVE